jgi:hypothetical protein
MPVNLLSLTNSAQLEAIGTEYGAMFDAQIQMRAVATQIQAGVTDDPRSA